MVVGVTRHQGIADAELLRFDESQLQNALGVTTPPEPGPDCIPDVSTSSPQCRVQPVADRDPPDEVPAVHRDEEGGGNPPVGEIPSLAGRLHVLEELGPCLVATVAQQELELFCSKFLVRDQCLLDIGSGEPS